MFKRSVIWVLAGVIVISLIAVAFLMPDSKRKNNAEQNKIALIYIEGVIVGGRGTSGFLNDYGGNEHIIRQLHEARDDQTVRAVVLRINSPGGSVPATQEIGEELKKLRRSGKLVVASMGDITASGGYWLAALTDKIYANPATLTGSIGVYVPYANWEELSKKIGIHQEKIKSGPHKDILSPERMMTKEERDMIQVMVNDLYEQFVAVVAEGRKMDAARVRQLADGRIYTGSQAKQLGLVDELGNMYDAIDEAARMAGITGKPELKEFGKMSPWSILFGAGGQVNIGQFLKKQLDSHLSLGAPMALPDSW